MRRIRCAADAACNERFPALPEQFARLDARLRLRPVPVTLADPVTGETRNPDVTRTHLLTMARMLVYSPGTASILPLVVHEAATRGNYAPLAAQAESFVLAIQENRPVPVDGAEGRRVLKLALDIGRLVRERLARFQ